MSKALRSAFGLLVGCALFAATTSVASAQETQKQNDGKEQGQEMTGNQYPPAPKPDDTITTVKPGNSDNPPAFPVVSMKQEDKRDVAPVVVNSSDTTTTKPAAAPAVAAVTPQPATEILGKQVERPVAFTGFDSMPMVLAGAAFTVLGAGLLTVSRRRKGTQHLHK